MWCGVRSGWQTAVHIVRNAGIAQLVEHHLAKVGVAGSSPVSRSPPTGRLFATSAGSPRGAFTAPWPSGKAEDCKSFIPGSNPGGASYRPLLRIRAVGPSRPSRAHSRPDENRRFEPRRATRYRASARRPTSPPTRSAPPQRGRPIRAAPMVPPAHASRSPARPPRGVQVFPYVMAGEAERRLLGFRGVPGSVWTQNGHKIARQPRRRFGGPDRASR